MQTAYLSASDLEGSLLKELKNVTAQYGRLILAEGPPQDVHFAQNIWLNPQLISFHSISDAAKKLRALHGLWALYPYQNLRKAELISKQLPYFSPKPLEFLSPLPKAPLGSWTLLDDQTLLASPQCTSPFANGEVHFVETKLPPSRAYLKLWEVFTKMGIRPKADDVCLEIGASPGGWTWVLQNLNAKVIAVDRSPLAPSLSHVQFLKRDAFSLLPKDLPKLNWIFSDVVCYPEKLLHWIHQWQSQDVNFVCTIKFQGEDDYKILEEFKKIKGSQIVHLFHNKHELTWVKINS